MSANDYVDVRLPRGTARAVVARLSPLYPIGVDVDLDYLVEMLQEALVEEPRPLLGDALLYAVGRIRTHLAERIRYQQEERKRTPRTAYFDQGLRKGKEQAYEEIDALLRAIEEGAKMGAETDVVRVYEARDGWRWRRVAENGNVVADSGEGYANKQHAREMAESRNPGVIVETEEDEGAGSD